MKNRKIGKLTAAGFVVLILLVVAVLISNSLRRYSHIVLPDLTPDAAASSGALGEASGEAALITVTPQTVQAAVETLDRPEHYRRSVTVERLWNGGSGRTELTVTVSGVWTRVDTVLSASRTRHVITNGQETYVWYNSERAVFSGGAADITADQEQTIPTYEDILALSPEQIVTADYRALSGVNCIYVETGEDENGYALRYWVSVDSGLLVGAERLEDGETIYRMGALSLETAEPSEADFTLPDGTVLLDREE